MALKAFHIFFISVALLLGISIGVSYLREFAASKNGMSLAIGAASLAGTAALAFYLFWFLRKMKRIS